MRQQRLKLQIPLNYTIIPENVVSERVVVDPKAGGINWFHVTHLLANLIISSIHAWLDRNYRLPGVPPVVLL